MKKGFVRTLEAIIAVLVVFMFVVTVLPSGEERDVVERKPVEIRLLQEAIINEIQTNTTFRDAVLINDNSKIDLYISSTINLVGNYDYSLIIQDVGAVITIPSGLPEDRNVYSDGVVIGGNLNTYRPKIVTLYVWGE